jgi:hypothetical protein
LNILGGAYSKKLAPNRVRTGEMERDFGYIME